MTTKQGTWCVSEIGDINARTAICRSGFVIEPASLIERWIWKGHAFFWPPLATETRAWDFTASHCFVGCLWFIWKSTPPKSVADIYSRLSFECSRGRTPYRVCLDEKERPLLYIPDFSDSAERSSGAHAQVLQRGDWGRQSHGTVDGHPIGHWRKAAYLAIWPGGLRPMATKDGLRSERVPSFCSRWAFRLFFSFFFLLSGCSLLTQIIRRKSSEGYFVVFEKAVLGNMPHECVIKIDF